MGQVAAKYTIDLDPVVCPELTCQSPPDDSGRLRGGAGAHAHAIQRSKLHKRLRPPRWLRAERVQQQRQQEEILAPLSIGVAQRAAEHIPARLERCAA